jgi:hypothetical protein
LNETGIPPALFPRIINAYDAYAHDCLQLFKEAMSGSLLELRSGSIVS